jgi:hypothetical protein
VKRRSKEELFENYVLTALEVFPEIEIQFNADGLSLQVTGIAWDSELNNPKKFDVAKDHMRGSDAWRMLSSMYDYAVDGIVDQFDPDEMVIDSASILSNLQTENHSHSLEWTKLVTNADARFGLDHGDSLSIDRVALLASVDVRTVRNAISAGELVAEKNGSIVFIENESARNWLSGRRGYKPTRMKVELANKITEVSTPAEFGSYLAAQRKHLALDTDGKKLLVFHPSVDANSIIEIEKGVFKLPLDTVFPLADFYQIDRDDFLHTVMSIFYAEQYRLLYTDHMNDEENNNV